jgi:acyl carrier protein
VTSPPAPPAADTTRQTPPVQPDGTGSKIHQYRKDQPVAASIDEIRAGLAEILNEVADVDAADVSDEKSFTDDLDVDSLSMVEVAMAAEDKFGVKIPDDELPKLKTVGDAVNYIHSNA